MIKLKAIKYIEKYYGSIENNKSLNLKKSRADFSSRDFFTIQEDVTKPVVFISFKKPKYSDERLRELYALDLFIEIMDGGYSSRLTENLVNSKKIALDTFISNDTYNQHNSLIIIGGTPRGDVTPDEFKAHVLDEFSLESIDSISQVELDSAKARIKSNSVFKFDSVFYQAMQVGMLETKNISWENLDKYYTISESITLDEIKSAARSYIQNNQPLVTVLRPKQ